ncbi:MAG: hypothetical protein RJA69_1829 [Pseudomonadota bacterium]
MSPHLTAYMPPLAACPGWLRAGLTLSALRSLYLSHLTRQVRWLAGCILLGGMGSAAHADWTFLAVKDGMTYMVDRNTIATAGPYKRIWMLQNYPQPYSYGAQSVAMLMEVECPQYRIRFNQLVAHAGQHLTGALIESITQPGPWEGISPGPFRSVHDLLCRTNNPRLDPQPPQPPKR